jgi:hypothetical protein
MQPGESLCVRTGTKGWFAPHSAQWGTQHVACPHTYAVGEDPVSSQYCATGETTLRVAYITQLQGLVALEPQTHQFQSYPGQPAFL